MENNDIIINELNGELKLVNKNNEFLNSIIIYKEDELNKLNKQINSLTEKNKF
jgi:hypothetical protein